MATLAELYEFLETKQDDSHLDSRFSYDAFLPVEQQQGLFNDYQSSFRLEENVLSSPAFSDNLHSNFLI